MNFKKNIVIFLSMIFVVMFSSSSIVSGFSLKGNIPVENGEIKKTDNQESKSEIKIKKPYRQKTKEEKEKIEQTKAKSKLRGKAKKQYQDTNNNELIVVRVTVDFNYSESEFESEVTKLLGNEIKLQKTEFNEYDLTVTKKQIDILESMKQVRYINLPDDEEDFISGETSDGDYISLNAATEMTGTKKARTDFGVTGDYDNATSYSKDDFVIAVLDSGIDTNHIDLDGGKVIAWHDVVNGQSSPYDDNGHGTHVASIIAGTGEGDLGIQAGYAPGTALVGVKVTNAFGSGSEQNVEDGLQWIWDNKDIYNIDAVNMSIGTHASYSEREDIINLINDLNNAGIPVFVAAGNEGDGDLGYYYNTLSTYAIYTDFSVGSVKDPYEGGWGLSDFSSRGTGTQGPWICAPGSFIRAAKAGTTNEYITISGTSMATPAVSGTYALMLDAALTNQNYDLSFTTNDLGSTGYDKCYGNGSMDSYDSIKDAGNISTGSFNNYRDIIRAHDFATSGYLNVYSIDVYGTGAAFNTTLLILNENNEDLDLYIWEPGKSWQSDAPTFSSNTNSDMPYESINISSPKLGTYTIVVAGINSAYYSLDFCGQITNTP